MDTKVKENRKDIGAAMKENAKEKPPAVRTRDPRNGDSTDVVQQPGERVPTVDVIELSSDSENEESNQQGASKIVAKKKEVKVKQTNNGGGCTAENVQGKVQRGGKRNGKGHGIFQPSESNVLLIDLTLETEDEIGTGIIFDLKEVEEANKELNRSPIKFGTEGKCENENRQNEKTVFGIFKVLTEKVSCKRKGETMEPRLTKFPSLGLLNPDNLVNESGMKEASYEDERGNMGDSRDGVNLNFKDGAFSFKQCDNDGEGEEEEESVEESESLDERENMEERERERQQENGGEEESNEERASEENGKSDVNNENGLQLSLNECKKSLYY
ncbi:unnamed protein product [Orchesella dallaii]|uniref:Uncharacterized protein n=1 Tax=Orchesella dallaii TaxID=48710 RepID=A0ABP1R838_9HEXA